MYVLTHAQELKLTRRGAARLREIDGLSMVRVGFPATLQMVLDDRLVMVTLDQASRPTYQGDDGWVLSVGEFVPAMGEVRAPVHLVPHDDGRWDAFVPDLPGCQVSADSAETALSLLPGAQTAWIEAELTPLPGEPHLV